MKTPVETASPPRHHVLLIGIDAYEGVDPLHGCVNDVDAIEALLLDRLAVPPEAITKLVAPHSWHARRPRIPEKEPTSEHLRAALSALAGEGVRHGDRVLVYYAGHGTQVLPRYAPTAREALVPVDVHEGGALLYDHELNALLRDVARRTSDLTVVLDCCCSAGASRSALRPPDSGVRFCAIDDAAREPAPASRGSGAPPEGLLASLDPSDPGYLVAAACQSSERSHEGRGPDGRMHGAFTAALLERLADRPGAGIEAVRWVDVWQSLREHISARYPGQHPWLIGRAERRIFGGAFRRQDPGVPLTRMKGHYRLAAGALVGLGPGARVAVYGPAPDLFPPLGSAGDLAARLGVLEVETATPSSCTARAVHADLPVVEGARGRLIAVGPPDALVVALDPYDAKLGAWLEGGGPLRVVPAGKGAIAEAFVGVDAEGKRWIGDEIYGSGAERDEEPPLVRVPAGDPEALLRGLVHYARYNLALRLARRCRDLPGALLVRVLDARSCAALAAADLHDPPLPEVPCDPERRARYRVDHGQPICIAVENRSSERLYANLLNCAASGRVELLGAAQLEIPPRRRQTFWRRGHLGEPFPCSLPAGRSSGVDRLIAVATTRPDVDLSFLTERRSFARAVLAVDRGVTPEEQEPRELWTATLVILKITRPAPGAR